MKTIDGNVEEKLSPKEIERKNTARKRLFFVLVGLVVIVFVLIAWAVVEHIVL